MEKTHAPQKKNKIIKEFFHKRIRTIRNLAVCCLAFEGAIGAYSAYQEIRYPESSHTLTNNYFTKNTELVLKAWQDTAENPLQTLASLYYLFPAYISYQLDLNQTLKEKLEEAVKHEKTLEAVKQLMQKDDQLDYAEIGGFLFLDEDEQGCCLLRFYDAPSKNEQDYLKLLREKSNPEKAVEYFKKGGMTKYFEDPEWINQLINELEKAAHPLKGSLLDNLILIFKYSSDNSYSLPVKESARYLYENFLDLKGRLIGGFHTHNINALPSESDLFWSRHLRQFVIIRQNEHSYQLCDLYKGKILNKYYIGKNTR